MAITGEHIHSFQYIDYEPENLSTTINKFLSEK